jgi:hypothetical protein
VKDGILLVLLGFFAGGYVLYRAGKAVARAQRAYRDWRQAIEAVKGLFRRTVELTKTAVMTLAAAALIVAFLVALLAGNIRHH